MMTDHNEDPDVLARLLRVAGRREEPPEEIHSRTLEVATAAWERKVGVRRRTLLLAWAAAASVLLAVGVMWLLGRGPMQEPAIVARVDRVIGTVEVRDRAGGDWVALTQASGVLRKGAAIRTRDDDLAGILLAGGASLRLAPETEIALESPTRLRLATGRVYLDSGSLYGDRKSVV